MVVGKVGSGVAEDSSLPADQTGVQSGGQPRAVVEGTKSLVALVARVAEVAMVEGAGMVAVVAMVVDCKSHIHNYNVERAPEHET
jgi:hypothetical protein